MLRGLQKQDERRLSLSDEPMRQWGRSVVLAEKTCASSSEADMKSKPHPRAQSIKFLTIVDVSPRRCASESRAVGALPLIGT
jgi:hypothetical protein